MRIGTHNGSFHADEVLAIAVLKSLYPSAIVVRTRDPETLSRCDIVVDVGGVYAPDRGAYDHHQVEGRPAPRENGVPYSSAGLIWKHFGGAMLVSDPRVAEIVDARLFQPVDALDNGYGTRMVTDGVEHCTVSDVISMLNPLWNTAPTPADFDAAFDVAVDLAKAILVRAINAAESDVYARDTVVTQLRQEVVVVSEFAPVMDYLIEAEEPKFYVFPAPGSDEWMVQCVPPSKGSFAQRVPMPEAWAGKRWSDLDAVTGRTDGVFCHAGRFIAGAKTREGAEALAELALKARNERLEALANGFMEQIASEARG